MKRNYLLGIVAGTLALASTAGAIQAAPLSATRELGVANGASATLQNVHWEHRRYHRHYYAPRYYGYRYYRPYGYYGYGYRPWYGYYDGPRYYRRWWW